MEYIQCLHCNKKYATNDKIRAAVGRKITCKACSESFEIVIFETPTASMLASNKAAVENETIEPSAKETMHKQPEHKKNNKPQKKTSLKDLEKKSFSPSMLLGITIIAISIYVFYADRSIDIGEPFVATETPKPNIQATNHPTLTPEEVSLVSKPKKNVPQELSEACKAIAAQEWVMDYTMMHGVPEKSEYARMLDESVQNTAEIRKKCGGANIVREVLASATKGIPPKWLEMHVSALITLGKKTPHF